MKASLLYFLEELRRRLIVCVAVFTLLFLIFAAFANDLYTLLADPLLKFLPKDHGLIATNIIAPFFIPYELALVAACCVGVPFFIYQLWRFIAPALYQKEKRLLWPLLWLSTLLFFLGMAFAYFVALPLLFKMLMKTVPVGVNLSPDMTQYFELTLKLLLMFGVVFEVPMVTILLVWSGVLQRTTLIRFRPYVIVGAFVLGMLVAPPDVLSQTIFALPLWWLFEIGIFLSKFWVR